MKIKSEYTILSECISDGIDLGYAHAFKHTDKPDKYNIKKAIYDAVMLEVTEYFVFDDKEF